MARIGLLLLLLIQWENSYAWWCSFNENSDGTYQEGSMYCEGISVEQSLEDHFCVWFRPDDPVCTQYQETICVDAIEYKTETCPPNHSGGLQYSRQFLCNQAAWTDWTVSSNNCTANPPSCIETSESRTVACPSGYEGQITETRISSCPNPYGTEVWSDWLESQNSCTQSTTDPVSPISVTSPTNPVSPTVTESAIAPQIDAQQTINPAEPTIESIVQEELGDLDDKVETSTSDKTESTKEVKQDKQDGDKKQSKNNVDNVVDNRKEIVHGFGLVLSLELLNKPMEFYQPPLEDLFTIIQEFPVNADTREFQLDLFKRHNIEDHYLDYSDNTWERIRRSDILQ
jgi:hypothetical protein